MTEKQYESQQISTSRVLKFLFGLWRISPKLVSLMMVTQASFAILTTVIAPLFVSHLLGNISNGSATLSNSTGLLIGYICILLAGDVIAVRTSILLSFLSVTKMQTSVFDKMIRSLMDKSTSFHANRMSGGIVSNATKLNGSIERFWDTIAFTGVPIVTTILSVCIALSFIFWQYAIVLFILSVISAFLIVKAQNRIAPYSQKASKLSSAAVAYFADTIGNISSVKAFAGEETESKMFHEKIMLWKRATLKEMKSVVVATASFGSILTIMNIAAFVAAVIATEHHLGNIATIYLVIVYTLSVVAQLWSVSGLTRTYIRIIGDAGPMIEVIDETADILDPQTPEEVRITAGHIRFDDVSFAHDENQAKLFSHFTLTIKAGEKVGLVGHSGSGKTSLTKLLLRFNDIAAGTITIDGQDVTAITQADLRRNISYVSQEPTLFHRTLEENIAYGHPGASKQQIIAAAKKAHALEFINQLPDGFDTLVGERGVKLSGGQRQRIAIARAILKDAPILILDEATSALDSESERLIQDALEKLMKGRTSIVVAHRLSTIAKLDRIIVLEDGSILEDGTHAQLLTQNGTYANLWSHQSGGFIEE
ncbi:ABC transporter ATP-binding protein [bacterium]|nr:MAG: ABC transporter ATP-binding protein [bacterium]